MRQVTVNLIEVNSCTALLYMLLVCISIYLKSVMRHKLLILDAYRLDAVSLLLSYIKYHYQNSMSTDETIHGCFSKPNEVHEHNSLGNTALYCFWQARPETESWISAENASYNINISSSSTIHHQIQSQNVGNLHRHLYCCLRVMVIFRCVLVPNKDNIDMP